MLNVARPSVGGELPGAHNSSASESALAPSSFPDIIQG